MTTPSPSPQFSEPFDPLWPHGHVLVQDGRRVRLLWIGSYYSLCLLEPDTNNNCPYVINKEGQPMNQHAGLRVRNKAVEPPPYDGPALPPSLWLIFNNAAGQPYFSTDALLQPGVEAIAPRLVLESEWFKKVVSMLYEATDRLEAYSTTWHRSRHVLLQVENWRQKHLRK